MQGVFIEARKGRLFGVYHAPASDPRGAVLYIHPFAEEMNKARRMAALQARALVAQGFAVLLLDLYGCGDSAGDFGDSEWDDWRDNITCGERWLSERAPGQPVLWGLRLGALLQLDYARQQGAQRSFMMWQPVLSGNSLLTQFLRLRSVGEILQGEQGVSTKALRAQLAGGEPLEVAGYWLSPAMADALDAVKAEQLALPGHNIVWLDIYAGDIKPLSPAIERVAQAWRDAGVQLQISRQSSAPFWSTQEIAESPGLIETSTKLFNEVLN